MRIVQCLNDAFRRSFDGGVVILAEGVASLNEQLLMQVFDSVRAYDAFDYGNICDDHEIGSFEIEGNRFCWVIDYYSMDGSSPMICDPTDCENTVRVLTISMMEEMFDD